MAVCSRTADYEGLTQKLDLRAAITLQPLTKAQVDNYLAREELTGLRQVMQTDATLQAMAETPFLLNTMAFAYQGMSPAGLKAPESDDAPNARRTHLFEAYVERRLTPPPGPLSAPGEWEKYTPRLTRHYLTWLAGKMVGQKQTVFYIEGLQPVLLIKKGQRGIYWWGVIVVFCLIASSGTGLAVSLVLALQKPSRHNLIGDFLAVSLISLIVAFLLIPYSAWFNDRYVKSFKENKIDRFYKAIFVIQSKLTREPLEDLIRDQQERTLTLWTISPRTRITFSGARARRQIKVLFLSSVFALGSILCNYLVVSKPSEFRDSQLKLMPLYIIMIIFAWLASSLTSSEVGVGGKPSSDIKQSLTNAFVSALVSMLIAGLISSWLLPKEFPVGVAIISSLLVGLNFGGGTVIRHVVLRLVLWRAGYAPLNYARFLDYCADRVLLRKVGGGYIFIHRYLLEYFASLEQD